MANSNSERDDSTVRRVPVPAPREPLRLDLIAGLEQVRTRRVIVSNEDGTHRGYIAWSEPYERDGHLFVDVVAEESYWRNRLLGARPDTVLTWPAGAAWLD